MENWITDLRVRVHMQVVLTKGSPVELLCYFFVPKLLQNRLITNKDILLRKSFTYTHATHTHTTLYYV
jgi:hypothetical protein